QIVSARDTAEIEQAAGQAESAIDVVIETTQDQQAETTDDRISETQQEDVLDPELIEVFLEEVDEIFEVIAESKQAWMDDSNNVQAVDQLQRALHTLKGSSRMAGISAVGDLAHELETIYVDAVAGQMTASPDLFALLHECDDRLADLIGMVRKGVIGETPHELINRVKRFHESQKVGAQPSSTETVVFDTALGATVEADAEALDAFFKHATELLKSLKQLVNKAKKKNASKEGVYKDLQGELNTLKTASFDVNLQETGDLCQLFEEVLGNLEPGELGRDEVQVELTDWLERVDASFQDAMASAQGADEKADDTLKEVEATTSQVKATPQETVRVPAALLEQLVD
ncbi:MAG: Hpt domain-containing protein, partial [Pirellulales bacterium]|nr:Hpt domain-containing protein [Pirellulales bacterium]